jgi:ribosomal protein S12 methylthiotransferase
MGRRLDVLLDRAVPDEKNAWIGRSAADAPDVDGVVYVSGAKLRPGRIVECEMVATSDYDLVGVAVGKPR